MSNMESFLQPSSARTRPRNSQPDASLGSANDLGAPPELSGPLDGARLQASGLLSEINDNVFEKGLGMNTLN